MSMPVHNLALRKESLPEALKFLRAEEISEMCIMIIHIILTHFEEKLVRLTTSYYFSRRRHLQLIERWNTFPHHYQLALVDKLRIIQLVTTRQTNQRYPEIHLQNIIGFEYALCKESGIVKPKTMFHLDNLPGAFLNRIPDDELIQLLSIVINAGLLAIKTEVKSETGFSVLDKFEKTFNTTTNVLREFISSQQASSKSPPVRNIACVQLQVITRNCADIRPSFMASYGTPMRDDDDDALSELLNSARESLFI
jgi:hypothetical protein